MSLTGGGEFWAGFGEIGLYFAVLPDWARFYGSNFGGVYANKPRMSGLKSKVERMGAVTEQGRRLRI